MIRLTENIAKEREDFADTLSQNEIWRQVVRNAIKMDASIEMKADILLGAIPDLAVIYSQLKFNNRIGDLTNDELANFLKIIIERIEQKSSEVEFNPLNIDESIENNEK